MPISMSKQYRTRNGNAARVLATDAGGEYPVVAIVAGREGVQVYRPDGGFYATDEPDEMDLVEVQSEAEVIREVRDHRGQWRTLRLTWRDNDLVSAVVVSA